MLEVESRFEPLPPQWEFFTSSAKIRGYGGAMGGGKTRCLCEWTFDLALQHPGLRAVVARQTHTSIIETTRRTMIDDRVIPPEAIMEKKESGGEDYVKLWNGSQINFIGLEDPVRWFSSELGLLVFDEAHEISEDTVISLYSRLRQRCPDCQKASNPECEHYPHLAALGFNPENPGHFLYRWFIEGANEMVWPADYPDEKYAGKRKGYQKDELFVRDGDSPIGDCEFIFARAFDNPFLPRNYISLNLGGMPKRLRDRFLNGEWLYTSGESFFDKEALTDLRDVLKSPWRQGVTQGDPTGKPKDPKDRPRIKTGSGPWWIWKPPIRENHDKGVKAHRYIAAIDVSSGTANDYSAIQVLDVEAWEQVAEFQAKMDPDLVAVEAARIGYIYNDALLVPEITGGWGASIVRKLEDLKYRRIYTRRVEDRLSKLFTDKLGWDTTSSSRAFMLDKLEEIVREKTLKLRSHRLHTEMISFVWPHDKRGNTGPYKGTPQAQPGANDDLVAALAIGVAVMVKQPRELRRPVRRDRQPEFVTGY